MILCIEMLSLMEFPPLGSLLIATFFLPATFSLSLSVQAQSTSPAKTLVPPTTTIRPISAPMASSTSTGTKAAQTHKIQVGLADHKFRPDSVQAAVGDIVEFSFYPQNHSVVRAEYQHPCIPYEMVRPNNEGFYSGFHYVTAVLDNPPTYQLLINDSSPQFFYCSAPGSCINHGMVGVINPNSSNSLDTQRSLALSADYALSPGEPFPAESTPSNIVPNTPSHSTSRLGTGAIAGIAIGCVGVTVLGGSLFFLWGRSRALRKEQKRKDSTMVRTFSPRSPSLDFWSTTAPSPPYTQMPLSSHAKPAPGSITPAYFPSASSPTSMPFYSSAGTTTSGGRPSRNDSHTSIGGTFPISPNDYHTPSHEGQDTYKMAHTSDMTSPTDPSLVSTRQYKDQVYGLQQVAASASTRYQGRSSSSYSDVAAAANGPPVVVVHHVNRDYGPAELDDTSVRPGKFV